MEPTMAHAKNSNSNGNSSSSGKASSETSQKDAVALLMADHAAVKKLFGAYKKLMAQEADSSEKQDIAAQICGALTVHAQIEEEIFYPALREALDDQDMMDEAEVEHASCKDLIAQLEGMDAGDDLYDAKVTVLGEYIDHHVAEEEGEMFKQAKKVKLDLQALGSEMHARQQELKAEMGLDEDSQEDEDEDPVGDSSSRTSDGKSRARANA
ncbi:MAG: hemerythrin domain-containing protein [Bryobacteraceae bacterium]